MLLYRIVMAFVRPLAWVVFRPRVHGRENVRGRAGLVVCPNHLSGFDSVAVAYALAPRRMRSMAKNQLFRRPLLGPVVRVLGGFPARDGDGLPGGVAAGAALAARGGTIVIFPEGARRRGRVRRPRTGAARTAIEAGVPLVPAAVRGTDGWRRRVRWEIAFGAPVVLDDLQGRPLGDAAREATRRLWAQVTELESTLGPPSADQDSAGEAGLAR
jgi:1-acyl-sn-glycerol-3-phosphate acyltransferase